MKREKRREQRTGEEIRRDEMRKRKKEGGVEQGRIGKEEEIRNYTW
jgi:hypothetical protein